MARQKRRKFTAEFKAETVKLIRESDRSVGVPVYNARPARLRPCQAEVLVARRVRSALPAPFSFPGQPSFAYLISQPND